MKNNILPNENDLFFGELCRYIFLKKLRYLNQISNEYFLNYLTLRIIGIIVSWSLYNFGSYNDALNMIIPYYILDQY